jgi:thioredoxin 1
MPVICLGPICIPLWPVIAIAFKPVWDRFVPDNIKTKLTEFWRWVVSLLCPQRVTPQISSPGSVSNADDGLIVKVRDASHFQELKEGSAKTPVIFKFTAKWCGPCGQIQPTVVKLASKYYGKLIFAEIDIEELDDLALELGVASIPAFHAYTNGSKLREIVGASPQRLSELVNHVGGDLSPKKSK